MGQSSARHSLVTQCRNTVDIFWFLCLTKRNTSKENRPIWLFPFSKTVVCGSLSHLLDQRYSGDERCCIVVFTKSYVFVELYSSYESKIRLYVIWITVEEMKLPKEKVISQIIIRIPRGRRVTVVHQNIPPVRSDMHNSQALKHGCLNRKWPTYSPSHVSYLHTGPLTIHFIHFSGAPCLSFWSLNWVLHVSDHWRASCNNTATQFIWRPCLGLHFSWLNGHLAFKCMFTAFLQDTLVRYVCETAGYLLSRLVALTAANTRVFRVSPAMGMARCWTYEESWKTEHYRLQD